VNKIISRIVLFAGIAAIIGFSNISEARKGEKTFKAAEIEFVESVPEETIYGDSLTSRPVPVWLEMINGAAKTLDFEEFYIANMPGEALEPVLAAIKAAASRGVKVRFIVENAMMEETSKALPLLQHDPNIEVRIIAFKNIAGGIQHAKFFVADSSVVYVGSQNLDWRSLSQIHEMGARIKSDRAAHDFGEIFADDWALANGASSTDIFASQRGKSESFKPVTAKNPEKAMVRGKSVRYHLAFSPSGFIPDGFDVELDAMLRVINEATRTIHGQVMTYSLRARGKDSHWDELDKAFRAAGLRGVKVDLIFADWVMGGKGDEDIKALAQAENVSIKISVIPQNSRGFIPYSRVDHSKYLVVDGKKAMLSTSNWGADYFQNTRGAALIVEGAAGAAPLESVFHRSWTGPYVSPVDIAKAYEPVKKN
jgi:phosphatidylserine/phosphatidylglycerophosphate/cardiolipin synthase-like enzyme